MAAMLVAAMLSAAILVAAMLLAMLLVAMLLAMMTMMPTPRGSTMTVRSMSMMPGERMRGCQL